MSIALPPDLEQFIQSEVACGDFPSAEAAVSAAIRLLRDKTRQFRELQAELQAANEQIDRGECVELRNSEEIRDFAAQIKADSRQELLAEQNVK